MKMGVLVAAAAFVVMAQPAAAQRCARQWNALLQRYETTCDEGTKLYERRDPLFQRDQIDIYRGGPPFGTQPQRCYRTWNGLLQREEIRCN